MLLRTSGHAAQLPHAHQQVLQLDVARAIYRLIKSAFVELTLGFLRDASKFNHVGSPLLDRPPFVAMNMLDPHGFFFQ